MIERFRRWFDYERDAHNKVIASLESVPSDRKNSAEYAKAVALFGHLAAARRVWLGRLGAVPPLTKPLFPQDVALADVVADWREIEQAWVRFLQDSDNATIARALEYKSLDGDTFRNSVEDVLTQMFGHSWYHRGQIAVLVKAAGGEPAKTDFIFWCREAL